MAIIAKDTKKEYPKHPKGQATGICVDVIGPWRAVDDYDPKSPYLIQKIAYVWQTNKKRADGKPFELSRQFSLSFGKKANLRKFLGAWRGEAITDEEAKAGLDVAVFKGQVGLLTVEHALKRMGGIRADVTNISPLPEEMNPIAASDYTRADYWAKQIKEDEDVATRFEQTQMTEQAAQEERLEDFPAALREPEDDGSEEPPF